jgi:hypothetical protein
MLQNRFIVFLSVDLVEMSSEICVPGFWPVDIIGHTIGECGLIGAVFLAACRKKAEWISESVTSLSYLGNARLLVLMFRLYLYYRTYLGLSRYLDP